MSYPKALPARRGSISCVSSIAPSNIFKSSSLAHRQGGAGASHPKALPAGMAISELLEEHVEPIPRTHDDGNVDMESEFFDTRQVGCPVATPGLRPPIVTGNQQHLCIAKWLQGSNLQL